ncbi:hypothetical protein J1614_005562 [Plenodomus biglobosus]|nr:hypothetical protein J1614_005562 [Plenodomus biglobosus]
MCARWSTNEVTFRGPIHANGTGINNFGVVYNQAGADEDEVVKSWIKELASTSVSPPLKEEYLALETINTVLRGPELRRCLMNKKQTLVYEGRPGVGKTTTLNWITRHLDKGRAARPHQAPPQPAITIVRSNAQSKSFLTAILQYFVGTWLHLLLFLGYGAHDEKENPASISNHELKQHDQDAFTPEDVAHEVVIATVFFNAGGTHQDSQTPDSILMLILLQLVEKIPEGIEPAKTLWEQRKTTHLSTKAITDTIIAVLRSNAKACIFLDAIDEYNSDDLRKLLRAIEYVQHKALIGLVMTDRIQASERYTQYRQGWGLPDVETKLLQSEQSDIEIYLDLRMRDVNCNHWKWVLDRKLRQKFKESIIRASGGVFLLVRLNFEFVYQSSGTTDLYSNLNHIEKMPYNSGQDSEDYLKIVMLRAYNRNLERVLTSNRGRGFDNYARLILAFLRDAVRPLALDELQYLLQIKIISGNYTKGDGPSPETIQAACQGLVDIGPNGSNTVGFLHQSLHRYLEEEAGGRKYVPKNDEEIGRRCVGFLASDACEQGVCQDEKTLEARLKEHPLLNYAARYWTNHLKVFENSLADSSREPSFDQGTFHALALKFLLKDAHVETSAQILRFPDKFLAPISQRSNETNTPPTRLVLLLVNEDFVASQNPYQRTSTVGLHLASRHGLHTLVSRILMAELRQLECLDSNDWTPLHHAARGGHTPVVRVLLNYGAKVDGPKPGTLTPLMLATMFNHTKTINVLYDTSHGVDVNSQTRRPVDFTKSFTMATVEVDLDDELGASMFSGLATEYTRPYGRTLLQTAAREGNIELMKKLLQDPQLDKDMQDGDGRTALHTAAKKGKLSAVQLLIENGADHTCRVLCDRGGHPTTNESTKAEWYQNSVLHMASMYDRSCGVAEYLIQKFPELLNQVNGHRQVPLHLAVMYGQAKMVEELLKHTDVNINARDNNGQTPLHLAMLSYGKPWAICIQLLLQHPCIELNTTCAHGITSLALATRLGRPRYVELLSEYLKTHPVAPGPENAETELDGTTPALDNSNHPHQEHSIATHEDVSQSDISSSADFRVPPEAQGNGSTDSSHTPTKFTEPGRNSSQISTDDSHGIGE